MAVVTELVTKFDYIGSIAPLEKFQKGISLSGKALAGFAVATVAAGTAITAFAVNALEGVDAMTQLSRETGVSVEAMQELGYAASVNGSSVEAVTSTISSLSEKIGEAATRGSEDFSRLGISVRDSFGNVKDATQVLEEFRQRSQALNLSLQEQRSFAQKLGIDASLIQLLQKSGAEIDSLRSKARALGVVSEEEANAVVDFNDSLTTLKFGASALQKQFAIALAPEIKNLADGFVDLLIDNKSLINEGFSKVITVVGAMFSAVFNFIKLIDDIIDATVGWKIALIGLGLVLSASLSPMTLIIAGIVATIAIIDDLIVAFHGGKSVIADFFMEFFGWDIQPVLQGIVEGFNLAVGAIKDLLTGFVEFMSNIGGAVVAAFSGDWLGAIELIKQAYMTMGNAILDFFSNVFGFLVEPLNKLTDKITGAFGKFKGFLGFGGEGDDSESVVEQNTILQGMQPTDQDATVIYPDAGEQAEVINQTIPQYITQPAVSNNTSAMTSNSTSVQQDININVTGDNPAQIADTVKRVLNDEMTTAMQQTNHGGR
jgi:hypothetical protein